MLELQNITYKIEDKIILNSINLILEENKFYVLTGSNGSGKSTLSKIIMGIIKPTSGKIIYNNIDITNLSIDARANLGITFTFQTPVHFKGLKVSDLLSISRQYYYDTFLGKELLTKVGLDETYLNRKIDHTLSGGELKRIEMAIALAKSGTFTIFDEPEAGIDIWSFKDLINIFKNIKSKKNETILIISHQEKMFEIADEIILIDKGIIKEKGKRKIMKKLTTNNIGETNE